MVRGLRQTLRCDLPLSGVGVSFPPVAAVYGPAGSTILFMRKETVYRLERGRNLSNVKRLDAEGKTWRPRFCNAAALRF